MQECLVLGNMREPAVMHTSVDALADLATNFSESFPSQMKPRERPSEELDAIPVLHNETCPAYRL
jgi:hypothetical protein